MNILICDDIKQEADRLASLLHELDAKISPVVFNHGLDVLEYIHNGALVDVCFLDILMPEMSGVVLAEQLRAAGFSGEIIFLSASNEFAAESYTVDAFMYLLKPPTLESIAKVLEKIEYIRKSRDTDSVLLKTSGVAKSVLLRDISYVEAVRHKVCFRLIDGDDIEVYATFADITRELLSRPRFCQCHRSYVVNMENIAEITNWEVTMRNKKKIPVSRSYSEAKNMFFKWKFGGNQQ